MEMGTGPGNVCFERCRRKGGKGKPRRRSRRRGEGKWGVGWLEMGMREGVWSVERGWWG